MVSNPIKKITKIARGRNLLVNTALLSQQMYAYDITSCIIWRQNRVIWHHEQTPRASAGLLPVNSCTKSILSALVGIAMDQGLLPSPDTPVSDFYPVLRQDLDERKRQMTLRHLLNMTAGFRWQEFGGIESFPGMVRTDDWIGFVLKQPMVCAPGERFTYSSGVSQLLAGILAETLDMPIPKFAERHLFGPLGIGAYEWKTDPRGIATGGFGLQLAARDLLKFGQLYLQRGYWEGKPVVPQAYVEQSVQPDIAVEPPERGHYGWHWWTDEIPVPRDAVTGQSASVSYYYARGFGGQFVFVVPAFDAIVVFTRKRQRKGKSPHVLFRGHVFGQLALARI
jgi:CubicO group peptidase (beta-lactamase class C family)